MKFKNIYEEGGSGTVSLTNHQEAMGEQLRKEKIKRAQTPSLV